MALPHSLKSRWNQRKKCTSLLEHWHFLSAVWAPRLRLFGLPWWAEASESRNKVSVYSVSLCLSDILSQQHESQYSHTMRHRAAMKWLHFSSVTAIIKRRKSPESLQSSAFHMTSQAKQVRLPSRNLRSLETIRKSKAVNATKVKSRLSLGWEARLEPGTRHEIPGCGHYSWIMDSFVSFWCEYYLLKHLPCSYCIAHMGFSSGLSASVEI